MFTFAALVVIIGIGNCKMQDAAARRTVILYSKTTLCKQEWLLLVPKCQDGYHPDLYMVIPSF
jgi:hypothetical protein